MKEDRFQCTLTKPYYIGMTEVTMDQWKQVMKTPVPAVAADLPGDYPAHQVNWTEAVEFCRRLSAAESLSYRLPSEAEWEYACRAGTTTWWCNGNDIDHAYDVTWAGRMSNGDVGSVAPVASLRPNAWGLFDMHGNVMEFCQDWAGDYPTTAKIDWKGPASGAMHVARGGSFGRTAYYARSASRFGVGDVRSDHAGFRIVLEDGGTRSPGKP